MITYIISLLHQAFCRAFPEVPESYLEVVRSTQKGFGDYQCNSAMKLAKLLKRSPREIAHSLVDCLDASCFSSVEVAGPGFINMRCDGRWVASLAQKCLDDKDLLLVRPEVCERVLFDFSSPNIAKEMHVGHLRSTIIGDTLARHFAYLGHEVLRVNHVGDYGTQFGMLLCWIKEHGLSCLEGASLSDLMEWYRASKLRFDASLEFKERAKREVVFLQSGDEESVACWDRICEISRRGYQKIYDVLGVDLEEKGESYYQGRIPLMLERLEARGVIEESAGARCVFADTLKNREGDRLPLMLQKSDGGYTYDTTDLAALEYRVCEEKVDAIYYVVDQSQSVHFELLFEVAQKVGILDREKVRVRHVPFGVVLGEDGKKFRTRSGETEKLSDLLDEAIVRATALVCEKNPLLSQSEALEMGRRLGLGAVKYADLSNHRSSDYQFSYDKMLRFEGNTAPYILYAYVRSCSILAKGSVSLSPIVCVHESERALCLHVLRFQEAVDEVVQECLPHRMCDYLFEFANLFHGFFRDCRVLGVPEEGSRLSLVQLSQSVLREGLGLLGIPVMESM